MIPEDVLRRIVAAVNAQPELYGCTIGFEGNNQSRVLQEGFAPSMNYGRVLIIVEESQAAAQPTQVVVSPSAGAPMVSPEQTTGTQPPADVSNRSKLWPELAGAGLSCGLAVWSGVGVVGGALAEVPTAGASTPLVILGWVGLGASAAQCVNGTVRSWHAIFRPNETTLNDWDNDKVYSRAFLVVDAIGVVTSLPALAKSMKSLLEVLERRGGLVAADKLLAMNRAARQSAIEKAFRQATQTAEHRAEIETALRQAGLTEREIARLGVRGLGSTANAVKVTNVISQGTARALSDSIKGVVQGTAGIGVSATPQSWTGSGSGSVNALIVHVMGD